MPTTRDDTIVAVSSPPGRSARALVRLSGPATHQIVARLIDQLAAAPRTLSPAKLHLGEAHLPVLASSFTGPHSFTGQDMAELQCPGNPALLERIVRAFLDVGSRLAQPGEFTFRAFLAGKLDLTQAEGVAATIAAASDGQLRAASMLREGRLGRYAAQRVDELASSLALVEAGIDFLDQDDVVPISPGKLLERLHHTAAELRELLANSRSWSAIDAPPRVVLVGAPSTGKSTLFNALLGRQRAVISPTPGTTRDILAEALTLRAGAGRSIEIMLMDLAGLDTPRTALDEQVQAAARRAIAEADLILAVTDGDSVSQMTGVECPVLRVRTKADLLPRDQDGFRDVAVSAHRGTGLDVLCRLIVDCLGTRATSITADTLALGPRHEAALRAATSHLDAAIGLLNPQRDSHALQQIEMIAAVLRAALDELESLGGRVSPDDIIGRVFATFCVGK